MSERAEMLAARLDAEMVGMADFVSGLDSTQLDAACGDPIGATVAHVLTHLREGTDQVRDWAAEVAAGVAATPAPAAGHTHDGGHAHDHDAGHAHDHDGGHAHEHDGGHAAAGGGDVGETAATLRAGAAYLAGMVRGLSDEQLEFTPPASPRLTDGTAPLHAILDFLVEDVAAHRAHLVRALAAERRPQDVR